MDGRSDDGSMEAGAERIVPIDALEYRGEAALGRALSLREPLEQAVAEGRPEPILDELFDLIRLGAK